MTSAWSTSYQTSFQDYRRQLTLASRVPPPAAPHDEYYNAYTVPNNPSFTRLASIANNNTNATSATSAATNGNSNNNLAVPRRMGGAPYASALNSYSNPVPGAMLGTTRGRLPLTQFPEYAALAIPAGLPTLRSNEPPLPTSAVPDATFYLSSYQNAAPSPATSQYQHDFASNHPASLGSGSSTLSSSNSAAVLPMFMTQPHLLSQTNSNPYGSPPPQPYGGLQSSLSNGALGGGGMGNTLVRRDGRTLKMSDSFDELRNGRVAAGGAHAAGMPSGGGVSRPEYGDALAAAGAVTSLYPTGMWNGGYLSARTQRV